MKALMIFLSMAASSMALGAVNSSELTCAQAGALVQEKGAVYFQIGQTESGVYGLGGNTINRVVNASGQNCLRDERAQRAYIPTSDNANCFAGYTCVQRDWNN